jgi:hypothetical protein
MQKTLLIGFTGDVVCFSHVLLNALDLHAKGHEARIIIEGGACSILPKFEDITTPFYSKFHECKAKGLIDCVCKACAAKMGTTESAVRLGLTLNGEMEGHPPIEPYLENGYSVITF